MQLRYKNPKLTASYAAIFRQKLSSFAGTNSFVLKTDLNHSVLETKGETVLQQSL